MSTAGHQAQYVVPTLRRSVPLHSAGFATSSGAVGAPKPAVNAHQADPGAVSEGSAELLRVLDPWLYRLPASIRLGIARYIARPSRMRVDELAVHVGVSRRTLDRMMSKAGVRTARLMRVATLAAMWAPMREREKGVADMARGFGYQRVKTFRRYCQQLLGGPPVKSGRELATAEFVGRLARALFTRGPDRGASS